MSTTTHETPQRLSGRHPVSVGYLVMGIAFLAMVGVWALIQTDVVNGSDIRWLMPVPWVLAGLGGLLALSLSGSRRRTARQTGWVDAPEPEGETYPQTHPENENEDENEENR